MRSLESNPRTGGGIAKERITRRSFQNQSSLTLGWTITLSPATKWQPSEIRSTPRLSLRGLSR
jgi:hypothetical protein